MAAAAAHPRGSAAVCSDLDFLQLLSGPWKPALKKKKKSQTGHIYRMLDGNRCGGDGGWVEPLKR